MPRQRQNYSAAVKKLHGEVEIKADSVEFSRAADPVSYSKEDAYYRIKDIVDAAYSQKDRAEDTIAEYEPKLEALPDPNQ